MRRVHPIVLVTGASSGIGRATARQLAGRGARLFLVSRNEDRLREVAEELQAIALRTDVTSSVDVRGMAETVREYTGRLDLLVNCAGQLEVGPAEELGVNAVDRLLQVNFMGVVRVIDACLPLLSKGQAPVVVNLSSIAGRMAPPFMAAYAASKFALNGYSHALRQELRPRGIHVGLVVPGPVDTPMVSGRIGGPHYPVPPGISVMSAERVARAIVQVIDRRLPELILPQRLVGAMRMASAYPSIVDIVYRMMEQRRPVSANSQIAP